MPDQSGLLHDYRYGYLIPVENVRAAIRSLYPVQLTAVAAQQLETTLEAWEPPTVPDIATSVTISLDLAERLNKHMATLAAEARCEDWINKAEIQQAWAEIHAARSNLSVVRSTTPSTSWFTTRTPAASDLKADPRWAQARIVGHVRLPDGELRWIVELLDGSQFRVVAREVSDDWR